MLACSGGFATTVLPAARARDVLLQNMAIGMLYGTIAAMTP